MSTDSDDKGSRYLPGEEGMWMFVLGDLFMFTLFFSLYLYYRSLDIALYQQSQQLLVLGFGVFNTLLLLTSSLFMVKAVQSTRNNETHKSKVFILLTTVCGIGFMVAKAVEWNAKIGSGISLITNEFFMYYFVLTGLHLLHVVVATVLLIFFLFIHRGNTVNQKKIMSLETRATFWHMVDLLWIIIFALLYLVK